MRAASGHALLEWGRNSGELGCCLIEATVLRSALGDSRCRIVSLFIKAEGPARGAGSTLLLAVLKSRQTLGIRLASSVLVGTLLFDARERIGDGDHDRSGDNWCLNRLSKAVVLLATLGHLSRSWIFFRCNAELPTSNIVYTLVLTVLKSWIAFRVFQAGCPLSGTLLLDTLQRISYGDRSGGLGCWLIEAIVLRSALGDINCGLGSLG